MSSTTALKYRAFLSYAHADTRSAKWLHGKLEAFRIDKDLAGRATEFAPIPRTLRPIFRDREDFSGGHTLTEATVAALDASAALIVLCSTVSAGRPAVNEEVRLFRWRHPDRPVIPVIVEGTYPHNFPPALRFKVDADGTVTDQPVTFLAPDVRDEGDGRELALAKVVARLIGVPPDEVFRRAERARRRSTNIRNGIIGVLALLVVAAGLSAYLFRGELTRNEALLEATLKTATEIVNTAVTQAEKYNVPRTATVEMLTRAEILFDNMARLGRPTPAMQRQKAWMLIQFARNYEILGDTTKQRQRADEAHRIMIGLAASSDGAGNVYLAVSHFELGVVLQSQGNLRDALESYHAALLLFSQIASADPGDTAWQRNLLLTHQRIGNVLQAQGDLAGALASYRASLAIAKGIADAAPSNAAAHSHLSASHTLIGDVLQAQGYPWEALERYHVALSVTDRLVKADPGNTAWRRELSTSHQRIGDVLLAQRNLPGALESFRASLTIDDDLAKSDRGNMGWQRDLSTTHMRIGDVLHDQGNLPGALESYRAALAIRERLATDDPSNTNWQDNLSAMHVRIGNALWAQNNLHGALESYHASLAILERLTKHDPGNVGWQGSLGLSLGNIALVQARLGERERALASLQAARAVFARLITVSPDNPWLPTRLAWIDDQISRLGR